MNASLKVLRFGPDCEFEFLTKVYFFGFSQYVFSLKLQHFRTAQLVD